MNTLLSHSKNAYSYQSEFKLKPVRRYSLLSGKLFVKSNAFFILILSFTIFAAIQTIQLNYLLSEAKTVGENVVCLKADQKAVYDILF